MTSLYLASAFFLGIHLLIAGTRLRDAIVGKIGEQRYMLFFSFSSLAGLIWMSWSFTFAKNEDILWIAPTWLPHAGGLIILIAFLFVVIGIMTPGPTSVGAGKMLKDEEAVTGISRITRHPFLWGTALWAAFHLTANGDLPSTVFFGTFLVLALLGTMSIDAKRKRNYGDDWAGFAAKTSNIPFGAILTGRNRLNLKEIGLVRAVAAVVLFGVVLYGHGWLFGVVPFMLPGS